MTSTIARAGCVLSGLLLLFVAAASATPATASPPAGAARPELTIITPVPDSVIATASVAAARSVHTEASVRIDDGLQLVSVRLNGRLVPAGAGGGVVHAELAGSDGLRAGVNRLRVEATRPGSKVPLNAVSQFAVTYPDAALITLSLQPGQGEGALVRPVLRVPASGLSTLSVTLNGSDVTALLGSPDASGDRLLELSAADPLRWGSNTLTVLASMYDGRTQTVTRSFDVDAHRDIAGIRLLSTAHVGQTVVLDAGTSRLAGGSGPGTVQWTLIRKPARSRIAISAEGRRESFVPDAPGRYVVRATVGTGADAGSATLTVTATYSGPLVPLNSIDGGSPSALAIGSDRFVVSGGLQVSVFDRTSLEWLSSQGFDTSSSGISAMGSYLKALPDTDLVFVTHPSTSPVVASGDVAALNTALGYIGGSYAGSWNLNMPSCWAGNTGYCNVNDYGWQPSTHPAAGSFSIAGVPGMQAGNAWRATATQQQSAEGRLTGYLSLGVPAQTAGAISYVIVAGADQFVPVDTCASGGPAQCVIKVGSQTFAPTPGANGFNIVTLDRTTLQPIWHGTATTVGQLSNALAYLKYPLPAGRQMAPPVFVDDQRVIVIQSVGTGILPPSTSAPFADLDYFGITPELLKAAMTDGTPYAAVGVASNLPWHGTATESSPLAGKQQTGRLRTVLSRNRDWLYTPTAGDPYGQTNLDLYSIMYQNPTPWSYVGDPAVAYIGAALNLPSDVRSAYTNGNVDFASKAALLANLTCTDPTACGPNFDAVKKQLLNEFDWVQGTRALITNLEYPFVVSQGSQPVNVQDVYDEISATIKPPPQADTSFGFLSMFVDVTNLAAAIAGATGQDDAGAALGLLSAAGEFATEFTPTPDGDSSDTLTGIVDSLDQQLADMQISYIEALDQLQAILVTDAGKLQAVGVAVGTNPAWNWSQGTSLSESITALNATSRSASYSALLPPTWGMWNLKPDNVTQYSSDDVTTYYCAGPQYPSVPIAVWSNALPANQLHAVTSVNSQQAIVSQVWTFSNIDTNSFPNGPVWAVNVPDQSLTDNLTSTNTLTGAFQYLPQWIRTTYNPPGHVVCSADNVHPSSAHVPPVIPNADAAKNQ